VRIKLTPANAPTCCAETIRTYQPLAAGATRRGQKPKEWLPPGYKISLFCVPCQHGLTYTHEAGWERTLTEADARTQKGSVAA